MQACLLKFHNKDATPKEISLEVSRDAVSHIMEWYGAYCNGDRYSVTVNGKKVRKDFNGQLVGDLP